jgi:glutathione S-transferase
MIAIIGNTVSPYVRKVLTVLIIKGLDFEIDPITPFYGDDDFARLSPMRRIPVLIDGDLVINDSTVIAQYLEEKYPAPSILPATPELRAKARWFEEYADDRLGDAFVWKGFGAVVVAPAVFGTPRDLDAFQRHLDSDVAAICDYLDSVAPADGFLAGPFSIADIAIASMSARCGMRAGRPTRRAGRGSRRFSPARRRTQRSRRPGNGPTPSSRLTRPASGTRRRKSVLRSRLEAISAERRGAAR